MVLSAGSTVAADVTPPPLPIAPPSVSDPAWIADPGCPTCQHGLPKSRCASCGPRLGHLTQKNKNAPYPVQLCPGACFGYFQTQWRRWEEVCPYPYQGVGVSDAPRRPGSPLPPPRSIDPPPQKMPEPKKPGSDTPPGNLPPRPMPSGKFGP
ncbi:MAG: hypothetical protein RMJ56_17650 [Gemmataceae bacterium]|nr:hypothetical protein [Gemmata sp.]MDW8199423.1 hypothetical protein [Gemmataceae bacterium]